jgi:hypothetical protein
MTTAPASLPDWTQHERWEFPNNYVLWRQEGVWELMRGFEVIKLYGPKQPALDAVQLDVELYDAYLTYRPTYR